MSKQEDEPITAWITRYALTIGIERVRGKVADRMLVCLDGRYFHGDDWHRSSTAAVARANVMRATKIASLKKAMQRLEELHIHAPKEPEVTP